MDFPAVQEHTVEKVSHGFLTHITLEAGRMAVDVEVLNGNLGVISHLLSAVCTGR